MSWVGVITDVGRTMLATYIGNSQGVKIKDVEYGSGTVAEGNMRAARALTQYKGEGSIARTQVESRSVQIAIQIGPSEGSSCTMKEIGVFATNQAGTAGTRTLLMLLQNTTGVEIPDVATFRDFLYVLTVNMPVSSTENISVDIDTTAVVGMQTFENRIAEVETPVSGASASEAGTGGMVPAPAAGDQGKFLRGDGTWANVPSPKVMTGATSSANGTSGLTPAPVKADRTKFLRGDGAWAEVSGMTAATSAKVGAAGLTPVAPVGSQGKFLRGDATWADVQEMGAATASKAGTAGLVPAPPSGANKKFLRGDKTWSDTVANLKIEGTLAQGTNVTASGDNSHAEGLGTTASGANQHVSGKYNVVNTNYAEIVGNGKGTNKRSNARTLDWEGNETLAGDLTLKAGSGYAISLYNQIIMPNTPIGIPVHGSTARQDVPNMTEKHILIRWNFSSSPEDAPPCALTWQTFDGHYNIANNGGSPNDESVQPIFAVPVDVPV